MIKAPAYDQARVDEEQGRAAVERLDRIVAQWRSGDEPGLTPEEIAEVVTAAYDYLKPYAPVFMSVRVTRTDDEQRPKLGDPMQREFQLLCAKYETQKPAFDAMLREYLGYRVGSASEAREPTLPPSEA